MNYARMKLNFKSTFSKVSFFSLQFLSYFVSIETDLSLPSSESSTSWLIFGEC